MKNLNSILICAALLGGNAVSAADDELGWSGKGGVGIVSQRGNSDNETISVSGELINTMDQWKHILGVNVLTSSEDDVDTANRFELLGQTNYKIDEHSYWFGSGRYEDDDFSQFSNQATLTVGYGRKLVDNERHQLDGELGVGYRRAELRASGTSETDPILRGRLRYEWAFSETATLSNATLVETGSDNTFGKNVTALTADIAQNFGLQVAFEVRHNTDVSEPTENSDFVTTVNLVYSIE